VAGVTRPAGVVHVWDLPAEKRPRHVPLPGVGSLLRRVGDAAGLTHMGVHLRSVEPGLAGTHRHFHTIEEEWVYVLSGRGRVRIGPHRLAVRAGSFVGFPPGPRPHHFLAEGEAPLVLLEGGERRPREDVGCWVDVPKWWGPPGGFIDPPGPVPPEEGEAGQCIHVDDVATKDFQHDVDPRARRAMRRLERSTGLLRQAVVWSQVEAGAHTTAFHTHDRTDEWVFLLAGRARLRIGDERCEVGPGDFVGHPAGRAPHGMEPLEPLTYLMGGERDAEDVVTYPEAGLRRVRGQLEPSDRGRS
jgi:uncharacterized cupin superfamily protein